jgi:hypothetical protein
MTLDLIKLAEQSGGTRKHVPAVWQFFDHELQEFARLVVEDVLREIVDDAMQKRFGSK